MNNQKPKLSYQLESPFTTTKWPEVSSKDQETIVELLCSLLSPIGTHRRNHHPPSKGKRSKKRKRTLSIPEPQEPKSSLIPPPPDISSHIITGFTSIQNFLSHPPSPSPSPSPSSSQNPTTLHIFTLTPLPPTSPFATYLPSLISTTALKSPYTITLTPLPASTAPLIANSLNISRISILGLLDTAPHSESLSKIIKECVGRIEIPWLEEVGRKEFLETRITVLETSIGVPVIRVKGVRVR